MQKIITFRRSENIIEIIIIILISGLAYLPFVSKFGYFNDDWYLMYLAAGADLGGGVVATMTHPLDYLRFILGDVDSLWSFTGYISPLELNVEDVAEIGLKLYNGAIGGVHLNYFQRPPVHQLEIVGANGTLRWDNIDGVLHFHQMSVPFGSFFQHPPAHITQIVSPKKL